MPLRLIGFCLSTILLRTAFAETMPPRANYVEISGVRLQYVDWGGRGEPLVLVPGRCQTPHVFADLAPLLTERFRVVGLTPRGCGRSGPAPNGYGLDQQIDELVGFMDAMGIRQATLAGHSSGGGKVVRLARRYPSRVSRIITLDTIYRSIPDEFEVKMDAAVREKLAPPASCHCNRTGTSSPPGSWEPGQRRWHVSSANRRRSEPMERSGIVPRWKAGRPPL